MVENALDENNNLKQDEKEEILTKVETYQENFVKALTYASFLLE